MIQVSRFEHRVLRFLYHALEFSGFNISQTDVFQLLPDERYHKLMISLRSLALVDF